MSDPDKEEELLNLTTYWVQGCRDSVWTNIESHNDPLRAIRHLQLLIIDDKHDELRLIMARMSPITGETEYSHMASFEGGQATDPDDADINAALDQTRPWDPDYEALDYPQMSLWQEERESDRQGTLMDLGALHQQNVSEDQAWENSASYHTDPSSETPLPASLPRRHRIESRRNPNQTRQSTAPAARSGKGRATALFSGLLAGTATLALAFGLAQPQEGWRILAAAEHEMQMLLPSPSLAALIRENQLPQIQQALARGADPNGRDMLDKPMLVIAAENGAYRIMDSLFHAGADPHRVEPAGDSIMQQWAAAGDVGAIQRSLEAGITADSLIITGKCLSPLSTAVANGRLRTSMLLAEAGASLDPLSGCESGPMDLAMLQPEIHDRLTLLKDRIAAERSLAIKKPEPELILVSDNRAVEIPNALPTEDPQSPEQRFDQAPPRNILARAIDEIENLRETEPANEQLAALTPLPERSSSSVEAVSVETTTIRAPKRPNPTETSQPLILDQEKLTGYLKAAIDQQDLRSVRHLMDNWPEGINRKEIQIFASDKWGSGLRPALDYALIREQFQISRILYDVGFRPSPEMLHVALDNAANPAFAKAASFLILSGAEVNGKVDGLTPLMRAVVRGSPALVSSLLKAGARTDIRASNGETALDFARRSGRKDVITLIGEQTDSAAYRDVMLGLSWSDSKDDLKSRLGECKTLMEGFTSCKLAHVDWLPASASIIAQFDDRNGGQLSALQIDSQLVDSPDQAKELFEQVSAAITKRLPDNAVPHQSRAALEGPDFFTSLQPGNNAGAYFNYWSDQDKSRPVYIHLKLSGYDSGRGYYRILIGNPYRSG